jgi:Lrp/AsnC family leucine-responsive transcriptional regulator
MSHSESALSRIDRHLLRELQKDGRITYSDLGRRVGLSTTACIDRVRKLEREKIISGYTAVIDPEAVGQYLIVLIQVTLTKNSQQTFHDFNKAVKQLPEVQECYLISGNFDYLIKARLQNMNHYRKFLGETLLALPGVQDSVSLPVMEQVKETTLIHIAD